MPTRPEKRLTYRVDLPGGQSRLRELILYVASRCQAAPRFGKIKLHKIIWRADFTAFASRGVPVTGRAYQRLTFGPAPVEMAPLLEEMTQDGLLEYRNTDFENKVIEKRPVAIAAPTMKFFSEDDIDFVDQAIIYYWDKTGKETSDDSHGVAWRTRENGDAMPYELAYLSDERLEGETATRALEFAKERGWHSR